MGVVLKLVLYNLFQFLLAFLVLNEFYFKPKLKKLQKKHQEELQNKNDDYSFGQTYYFIRKNKIFSGKLTYITSSEKKTYFYMDMGSERCVVQKVYRSAESCQRALKLKQESKKFNANEK